MKKQIYMFDFMDESIAFELGVNTEDYINKIEKTTPNRAAIIIDSVLSGEPELIKKARRVFNLID